MLLSIEMIEKKSQSIVSVKREEESHIEERLVKHAQSDCMVDKMKRNGDEEITFHYTLLALFFLLSFFVD
jgi:hypothetical protein